ncbi:MAG: hypothetical protein JWN66_2958 [Sphingomonas bacterium]|nr:hypothetical protein [Sphingomonas bacterium]
MVFPTGCATPVFPEAQKAGFCAIVADPGKFDGKTIAFRATLSVDQHAAVFVDAGCKGGLLGKGIYDERFARRVNPLLYGGLGYRDGISATYVGVVGRQKSSVHPSGEEYFITILDIRDPKKERPW